MKYGRIHRHKSRQMIQMKATAVDCVHRPQRYAVLHGPDKRNGARAVLQVRMRRASLAKLLHQYEYYNNRTFRSYYPSTCAHHFILHDRQHRPALVLPIRTAHLPPIGHRMRSRLVQQPLQIPRTVPRIAAAQIQALELLLHHQRSLHVIQLIAAQVHQAQSPQLIEQRRSCVPETRLRYVDRFEMIEGGEVLVDVRQILAVLDAQHLNVRKVVQDERRIEIGVWPAAQNQLFGVLHRWQAKIDVRHAAKALHRCVCERRTGAETGLRGARPVGADVAAVLNGRQVVVVDGLVIDGDAAEYCPNSSARNLMWI